MSVDTNKELFWKLLEVEHPKAELFCRRLAGDIAEGDDLYHDSLLVAMRKFDKLRDRGSFRPWLYRIIVNRFISGRRGPWHRKRVHLTAEIADLPARDNQAEFYAARRWIERGLAALSAGDRALVTLYELEGWSIAELAAMQGKPEGTIKSRLSRARRKMREAIAAYFPKENQKMENETDYALPQSET